MGMSDSRPGSRCCEWGNPMTSCCCTLTLCCCRRLQYPGLQKTRTTITIENTEGPRRLSEAVSISYRPPNKGLTTITGTPVCTGNKRL